MDKREDLLEAVQMYNDIVLMRENMQKIVAQIDIGKIEPGDSIHGFSYKEKRQLFVEVQYIDAYDERYKELLHKDAIHKLVEGALEIAGDKAYTISFSSPRCVQKPNSDRFWGDTERWRFEATVFIC